MNRGAIERTSAHFSAVHSTYSTFGPPIWLALAQLHPPLGARSARLAAAASSPAPPMATDMAGATAFTIEDSDSSGSHSSDEDMPSYATNVGPARPTGGWACSTAVSVASNVDMLHPKPHGTVWDGAQALGRQAEVVVMRAEPWGRAEHRAPALTGVSSFPDPATTGEVAPLSELTEQGRQSGKTTCPEGYVPSGHGVVNWRR